MASETLLDLEATGKHVDDAGDFAETDYRTARNVGYVDCAVERKKVVLAERKDVDVADYYDFGMIFVEFGIAEDLLDRLSVAVCQG